MSIRYYLHVSLQCPDKGPLKLLVRKLPRDQAFVLCHLLNRIQLEGENPRASETLSRRPQMYHPPPEGPNGYWTINPERQQQGKLNSAVPRYSPKHRTTPDVQTLRQEASKILSGIVQNIT